MLLNALDPELITRIITPLRKFSLTGSFTPRSNVGILLNKTLKSILGLNLIKELTDLSLGVHDMFGGFRDRVLDMHRTLQDKTKTTIVVVTSPNPVSISESLHITDVLNESHMNPSSVIVNRTHPDFSLDHDVISRINELDTSLLSPEELELLNKMLNFGLTSSHLFHSENHLTEQLSERLPKEISLHKLPLLNQDIKSLSDLQLLHPYMEELAYGMFNRMDTK